MTFSPKYRRAVFGLPGGDAYKRECDRLIRHICRLKSIELIDLFIGHDHVHIFFNTPRTMSQAQAAHLIKWFSSIWLRKKFPELQTYPKKTAFWQRNYFCRSVGGEAARVRDYIERHRK
jgi:REP element-mobilizing transposase RayT